MNKLRIAVLALAPVVALAGGCAVQREESKSPLVVEREKPVVVERERVYERDKPDVDVHIDR